MSLRDYDLAAKLDREGDYVEDFYALIMAAMKNADTENMAKLRAAWPEVYSEVVARYNAPRGLLVGEVDDEGWARDENGLRDPERRLVRTL